MDTKNLLLSPTKPIKEESAVSALDQLASLACSYVQTPVKPHLTSLNSFKDVASPLTKKEKVDTTTIDTLRLKLNFNQQDMDLCSELSLLKGSPSLFSRPMKRGRKRKEKTRESALPEVSEETSNLFENRSPSKVATKKTKVKRTKRQTGGQRKKRKNEWNDREIIILLQVTKIMIDCELKSVAKALFECIERSPGKSYGRAAEKKLKRMEIFENWKHCDKAKIITNINKKLTELGQDNQKIDSRIISIAKKYREEDHGQRYASRPRLLRKSEETHSTGFVGKQASISSSFTGYQRNNFGSLHLVPILEDSEVRRCIETMIKTLERTQKITPHLQQAC